MAWRRTKPKLSVGTAWRPGRAMPVRSSTSGACTPTGKVSSRTKRKLCSWYRLAAEQGDASAQYNLGVMYAKGRGVLKDEAEAVRWYRLAAEQGDAYAQNNLGVMYAQRARCPQSRSRSCALVPLGCRAGPRRCGEQPRGHATPWGKVSSRIPCVLTCGSILPVRMETRQHAQVETRLKKR